MIIGNTYYKVVKKIILASSFCVYQHFYSLQDIRSALIGEMKMPKFSLCETKLLRKNCYAVKTTTIALHIRKTPELQNTSYYSLKKKKTTSPLNSLSLLLDFHVVNTENCSRGQMKEAAPFILLHELVHRFKCLGEKIKQTF